MSLRNVVLVLLGLAAGALAGPPVFAAAASKFQEVIIRNSADEPVPTKPVGTTAIAGAVGITDGSKVGLADGTSVGLTDGAQVDIGNADANPVPVEVVADEQPQEQPFSWRSDALMPDDQLQDFGVSYTVPQGKTFVLNRASGFATAGIRRVGFELRSCFASGTGLYSYGIIHGNSDANRVWEMDGGQALRGGCEIVPFANHGTGEGSDSASFHVFGYLIDE